MNHDHYRDLIQRELDDDLSAEETALLDRHVLACAECRSERDEFRQLALGLSRLKPVVPERSFVGSMEFDFDELLRPQPQVAPLQKKARRLPARWWQGLSVAAVVVLAIGFTANYLPGSSSHTAGSGNPVVALGDSQSVKQAGDLNPNGGNAERSNAGAVEASGTGSSNAGVAAGNSGTGASVSSSAGGSVTGWQTSSVQPARSEAGGTGAASGAYGSAATSAGSIAGAKGGAGSSGSSGSSSGSGSSSAGAASQPAAPSSSTSGASVPPTATSGASGSDTKSPDASDPHAGGVVVADAGHDGHGTGLTGAVKPSDSHTGLAADSSSLQDRGQSYGLVAGALSAERPPLPLIVGYVQQKPGVLNQTLQQQVRAGDASARWATVPVQAVQHVLTDIGFAPTAVVTQNSDYPDRVNVTQGGQEFLVKLTQPFDTGRDGIWQPVQISRTLSLNSQEPTDKPILAYFDSLEKNNPVKFSNIQVEESLFMGRTVVGADMTSYTPFGIVQNRLAFSFRLRLNGDYSWSLDGTPVIRH